MLRFNCSLSLFVLVALLVACAGPAAAPTATPVPPTPTSIPPIPTPLSPTREPVNDAAEQTQGADPTATVKAWVGAINNGDLEAALALMTQAATFRGAFTEPAPNVVDWWIDIGSKNVVPNCQSENDQVICNYVHGDGCITAFGATGGLPVKMTFTLQDGKIRQVLVETQGDEWASYGQWSDVELEWAQANRAEELAKIDFQTLKEGGATAVELCREYAAANPTPTPTPVTLAAPGQVATTFGKITSQALAGNLLGDPTTRIFYVLLPPGYAGSDKRYPVVYVLHGYGGDATSLVEDFRHSYQAALDEGSVQEMIFVFPDASNKLGGSFYLSSPTIGDYETYISQELVNYIDATYRTLPDRASRGITGCSMGGDGSMGLALKYPSVFSVAAPVSGGYDSSGVGDGILEQATEFLENPPQDFEDAHAMPGESQLVLAWVAATASNPDKPPFYLDMPVEMVNGTAQLVPEVIDKMTANDPVDELDRYLAQPERLSAILIYHGNRDQMTAVEHARDFDKLLTDRGVEHAYLEAIAGHCDFGYLGYIPVVQFMSDNLVGEE